MAIHVLDLRRVLPFPGDHGTTPVNPHGCRVYRDGKLIGTLPLDSTVFDDVSPDYNFHSYRVEAFNDTGSASSPAQISAGCLY